MTTSAQVASQLPLEGPRGTRRRSLPIALALAFSPLGVAFAADDHGQPATPEVPNVVIVTIDTLRADRLGCYGYFRDLTPNIDAFAAKSILFENCRVPVAQTLPTHTSLFTGLYPREHGIRTNLSQARRIQVLAPDVLTLAQALAEGDYATAAFVSAEPVKAESGLSVGFQTWHEPEVKRVGAEETIGPTLDWLEEHRDRRFFLWVHLFDPHAPHRPPAPYNALFADDDPAMAAWLQERGVPGRGQVAPVNNSYDGAVRYADEMLGQLLEALDAPELRDRTAVVLTSDHGESVGQHGLLAHGDIWMEQLHVPLIVRSPGAQPGRVADPLTTRDIVPTLLGLHPTLPLGTLAEQTSGVDALAQRASGSGSATDRATFAELPSSRSRPARSITLGTWRYVTGDPAREALFDLESDPYELANVAESHPEKVAELRERLEVLCSEQADVRKRFRAQKWTEPSPERLENLKALGYLDE